MMRASTWSMLQRLLRHPNARVQLMDAMAKWAGNRNQKVAGHDYQARNDSQRHTRAIWFIGGILLLVWSLLSSFAYWILSLAGNWLSMQSVEVIEPSASLPFIEQLLHNAGGTVVALVWLGVSAIIVGLTTLVSRVAGLRASK